MIYTIAIFVIGFNLGFMLYKAIRTLMNQETSSAVVFVGCALIDLILLMLVLTLW